MNLQKLLIQIATKITDNFQVRSIEKLSRIIALEIFKETLYLFILRLKNFN